MEILNYKNTEEIEKILAKNESLYTDKQYKDTINILKDIKINGHNGVKKYTEKFDGIKINDDKFRVSQEEIKEAYNLVSDEFLIAIKKAKKNIVEYHKKQKINSTMDFSEGKVIGQLIRPIKRVGIYVPGGTAAYPSSVLMTALPAKVAGVEEIVMISPPSKDGSMNPYTLVAADICSVKEIYKVGGAQGIGALAYGTELIKKVDKIVGPGNIYVTIAKKEVYGYVDIDMLAGPSEVLIIADNRANKKFVAADLLSQCEHDNLAKSIVVVFDIAQAMEIKDEVYKQLENLERKEIARTSLLNNGKIIITNSIEEGIEFSNKYGPEHLELCINDPFKYLGAVKNAGAIFLGYYTPESVGDYFAGPNHVLPTSGTSRFYSPLNTHTFLKKMSVIKYEKETLKKNGKYIETLAECEGLGAHKNAVTIRIKKNEN